MSKHNLISAILFVLLAYLLISTSIRKPYYNWDMIGYISAAKSFEETNIDSLHSFTYREVRNLIPENVYESLTMGKYSLAISKDVSAFKEQLPFYQIRPVYNFTVYIFYKAGINIASATHIVSGIFMLFSVFMLYILSRTFLNPVLAYAVPLFVLIFGGLDIAILSTPDAMSSFAVITTCYFFLKKRYSYVLMLIPLLVGIRTDLILFVIPLLIVMYFLKTESRLKIVFVMIISILLYKGIEIYFGYPGWSTIFYFTLVEQVTHPLTNIPQLTLKKYGYSLNNGILLMQKDQAFLIYLTAVSYSVYLMLMKRKRHFKADRETSYPLYILQITGLVFVFAHFILLPILWERFFFPFYITATIILLIQISEMINSQNQVNHDSLKTKSLEPDQV